MLNEELEGSQSFETFLYLVSRAWQRGGVAIVCDGFTICRGDLDGSALFFALENLNGAIVFCQLPSGPLLGFGGLFRKHQKQKTNREET